MVRFGAHLSTSRVSGWEELYVDFNGLRDLASNPGTNAKAFSARWRGELAKSSAHFDMISREAVAALFSLRETNSLARKVAVQLPGLCKSANRGYGESFMFGETLSERRDSFYDDAADNDAPELQASVLPLFEQRRVFGLLNVEALRKLAKKLEKYVCPATASALYVELAMSPMASGVSTDFAAKLRDMIRECLVRCSPSASEEDLYGDDTDRADFESKSSGEVRLGKGRSSQPSSSAADCAVPEETRPNTSASVLGSSARHPSANQTVAPRSGAPRHTKSNSSTSSGPSPFDLLCNMINQVDSELRAKLVSHRGFHSKEDLLHRPLENTITAYEQSWASGLRYCECDITLTLDGRIVLCHDNDLHRLARDPGHTSAFQPVTKLTFEELYALPLKNGTSAPLLEDVLRTATRAGPAAKLVIEIKSGADGAEVAAALCRLMSENMTLLSRVAVVMSFDLYIIHNFNNFFKSTFGELNPAMAPKIMFLTRDAAEPDNAIEMPVDWDGRTSDELRADILGYVEQGSSCLDGVYMQYHPAMVQPNSACAKLVRELAETYTIGVWGYASDPDNVETAQRLSELGISFINTDLPDDFALPVEADAHDDQVDSANAFGGAAGLADCVSVESVGPHPVFAAQS